MPRATGQLRSVSWLGVKAALGPQRTLNQGELKLPDSSPVLHSAWGKWSELGAGWFCFNSDQGKEATYRFKSAFTAILYNVSMNINICDLFIFYRKLQLGSKLLDKPFVCWLHSTSGNYIMRHSKFSRRFN
ncbi:F-box/LRR-repeat protein 17 [Platysternon megacephalum]|uniref:F-box/LRR-repeat protein 17 n=1 Tax=Platysternon megacephalum TaxID=55544 RepID=A0A4D9F4Z8_9SAUR|nr:F-box/LRR-repeat protein 17 [Platysternon megacephalum]